MTAAGFERAESLSVVNDDAPSVYLFPGRLFTSSQPALVSTILGSCVAVCFWDPEAAVGGINHFLLPLNPARDGADVRYGNTAMTRLLDSMLERGAATRRLVAKIVGGATVLEAFSGARRSIGDQNIAVAREFLRRLDIRITGDQTGGRRGRKLLFHTGNGSACVREI